MNDDDETRVARSIIRLGFIGVLIWAVLGAGCAFVEDVMTRQSTEPPKTYLGRTELKVNVRSRETDFGTSIDDYTCGEELLYCEVWGSTMYCRCVTRGL